MLLRVLEPEVMDTAEEAESYDAMDHAEVNRRFCEDLLALEPQPSNVVDVGTGTALIPVALCRLHPRCRVIATDMAEHMLRVARQNVARAGLDDRITLAKVDAKGSDLKRRSFDVVMSNSIVHHIAKPERAFAEMLGLLSPRGLLFVRDLERPADEETLRALVERYTARDTETQRALFEASLRAALTVDEVVAMIEPLGVPATAVTRTSDRHWTIAHRGG